MHAITDLNCDTPLQIWYSMCAQTVCVQPSLALLLFVQPYCPSQGCFCIIINMTTV